MKIFRKGISLMLALVMVLSLAACGSKKEESEALTPTPEAPSLTPIVTGPVEAPGIVEREPAVSEAAKPELNKAISISFVGDIICNSQFKDKYDSEEGPLGVVSEKVLSAMKDADLCVANHEYCSTDIPESNKLSYQTWIEQAPSANEEMFASLGIDVCSMANNHAFDYGPQGFVDTLDNLKKLNIDVTGAGMNMDEATDPVVKEIGGKSVAIFAASSILTTTALAEWTARENTPGMNVLFPWYDTYEMWEQKLKEASEKYDFVIALIHWGEEKKNMFNRDQQTWAHMLIDAGVDVIIGDHAHVLQGIEYYNDGVCFYGMSNFIFSPYQSDTMVLTMNIDNDKNVSFSILPCTSAYYYTQEATSSAVFDTINANSVNAKVLEDGTVTRME